MTNFPNAVLSVLNIAALRANLVPHPVIFVAGLAAGSDGGQANFWYKAADTTSGDNGTTIIVDAAGHRYYREVATQFSFETTLASGTTTDLGTALTNLINITGVTSITSFASSANTANPIYILTFAGIMLLTYNATTLILPGAADITTAVGDSGIFQYLGGGNWQCLAYFPTGPDTSTAVPPAGSFKNLAITVTGNSQLTIAADSAVLWNASNAGFTAISPSFTVSTGSTGVNGLDTGTIANSTFYSVWLIYNPSTATAAALISVSATAPTLPAGFTFKARFGWVLTDSSAHLMRTFQLGDTAQYVVTTATNTANLPKMTSGTSGNPSIPTWTGVAIAGFVPTTAKAIRLMVSSGNSEAAVAVIVAPNNSYGVQESTTNPSPVNMSGNTTDFSLNAIYDFVIEGADIYYASTANTSSVWCFGWIDQI